MRNFTNRLIASSRVRLGVTYLSIIMVLSLGFSLVFYIQSVQEATDNLRRQSGELRVYLYFASPEDIQDIQDNQLKLFKKSLLRRLAVLNLGMLLLGGSVSLVLAKRSLRPLEEALESQSRFTSDAAHELRTPLTAMKTEIEVSLRDKNLKLKDARNVMSSSLEEIGKLEALTSALLRLASGSNTDKSNWQDYKLVEILQTAVDRLADEAKAKDIDVLLPSSNITVFGDPDQLVELFTTIISNAIKYSSNKAPIRIKIESIQNSEVRVEIIDKGIGIADIDLPHIFERFYRADQSRSKARVDGYGLGLSLAKSIADQHEARILVNSEYGKGSRFTVILKGS